MKTFGDSQKNQTAILSFIEYKNVTFLFQEKNKKL